MPRYSATIRHFLLKTRHWQIVKRLGNFCLKTRHRHRPTACRTAKTFINGYMDRLDPQNRKYTFPEYVQAIRNVKNIHIDRQNMSRYGVSAVLLYWVIRWPKKIFSHGIEYLLRFNKHNGEHQMLCCSFRGGLNEYFSVPKKEMMPSKSS